MIKPAQEIFSKNRISLGSNRGLPNLCAQRFFWNTIVIMQSLKNILLKNLRGLANL
jgi:hypothetical protein